MHCTSPTPPTADCDTSSWYSSLIWGATSSARERTRKSGIGETYVQILAPALTSCPGDQTSLGLSRLENYSLFLKELLRGRMLYRFKKPLNQVGPSDSVNLISWMWSSERDCFSCVGCGSPSHLMLGPYYTILSISSCLSSPSLKVRTSFLSLIQNAQSFVLTVIRNREGVLISGTFKHPVTWWVKTWEHCANLGPETNWILK